MGEIMRWRLARSAQRRIPADVSLLALDGGGAYQLSANTLRRLQSLQNAPDAAAYTTYVQILTDISSITQYLTTAPAANARAAPAAAAPTPIPNTALTAFLALIQLDRWLASQQDAPLVADLNTEVSGLLAPYLGTPTWTNIHTLLDEFFYAALIISAYSMSVGDPFPLTEVLGWLCRMILVVGLVDLQQLAPSPLLVPNDIYNALRWRTPVLPDSIALILSLIRMRNQAVIVRKPGFADLYITREEWDHYEPAEIASIENILSYETKSHVQVLVNRTQTSTTVDTSTTTVKEQDTTTTDLTQLQQQSTSDISIAAHVDGQVDTSGQYGPTQVNTHLGGSLDYSSATSTSKSITQSHETVARAVNRVEQTTRQIRTVSTMTESVDKEVHKFNNQTDSDVVGIYRWVDQIQNVELDRYPHRFLMEFQIPEPGAWTRWLQSVNADQGMINQLPVPFTADGNPIRPPNPNAVPPDPGNPLLTADDIKPDTYRALAARYFVAGASTPPEPLTIATTLGAIADVKTGPAPRILIGDQSDTSLTAPDGYQVGQYPVNNENNYSWTASLLYVTGGYAAKDTTFTDPHIDITVGGGLPVRSAPANANPPNQRGTAVQSTGDVFRDQVQGQTGPISQGNIPVALQLVDLTGFEVNIELYCVPTDQTLRQWQNDTYAIILGGYSAILQAYNDEKAGRSVQQNNPVDQNSPAQNQDSITQELKRQVIEMLTGRTFNGCNAISLDNTGKPTTQLSQAAQCAPEIQFLEQCFEWETLSYICYPYYWADSSRWPNLAVIEGDDSNFADFLRAGSARVVLAARPGFEDQVNFYVNYGILWGGGPMPAPGDENYLSIADEIKAQQQRPLDVSVMDAWQVTLPTTLIWLENNDGLPSNPSPTILVLNKVFPSYGAVGDSIAIFGSNFQSLQGNSSVLFNGTAAVPTAWSSYAITVPVPANASTGNIVVTVNGLTSNGINFVVTVPGNALPPVAANRLIANVARNVPRKPPKRKKGRGRRAKV
jgi:IPT/TIG domain-containing protein